MVAKKSSVRDWFTSSGLKFRLWKEDRQDHVRHSERLSCLEWCILKILVYERKTVMAGSHSFHHCISRQGDGLLWQAFREHEQLNMEFTTPTTCYHAIIFIHALNMLTVFPLFSAALLLKKSYLLYVFHYILYTKIIWKKVEEYLRLFETYGRNRCSLFLRSGLRKLSNFEGQMGLRMKLIAKKELIPLFQMTPSRILCNR